METVHFLFREQCPAPWPAVPDHKYMSDDGRTEMALYAAAPPVSGSRDPKLPLEGRWHGRLLGGHGSWSGKQLVMLVWFLAPSNQQEDLDRWYVEEHVPMLMQDPGWLSCHRYASADSDDPIARVAIHELRDMEVLESPFRRAARQTPWREKWLEFDWFKNGPHHMFIPDDQVGESASALPGSSASRRTPS